MAKHNLKCVECGSRKGLSDYEDHVYCHACGHHEFKNKGVRVDKVTEAKSANLSRLTPLPPKFRPLADRGISARAAERAKVGVYPNAEEHGKLHCYPYFTPDGIHVANKIRKTDGTYFIEGDLSQAGLFNQHNCPPGGKIITITEGECDMMATDDMTGNRYFVVSVKNGADGAVRDCTEQFEYLNSFDSIVINFDTDGPKVNPKTGAVRYPGQEAAQAVANLFPIGKAKILTL